MTTATTIAPAIQRTAAVLERIQNTIKNDNGAKADLKRALTGEPRHRRAAYPLILRHLSEAEEKYNLDQWLLVMCLLAYYPQTIDPANKLTFGDSARQLMTGNSSGGPERRFRALLETSQEDLRSPLTALVRLMKANNIAINYPQLLVDLCRWDHPDQFIQDKWARAFWNVPKSMSVEKSADDLTET